MTNDQVHSTTTYDLQSLLDEWVRRQVEEEAIDIVNMYYFNY
jgi:hypothetical protein